MASLRPLPPLPLLLLVCFCCFCSTSSRPRALVQAARTSPYCPAAPRTCAQIQAGDYELVTNATLAGRFRVDSAQLATSFATALGASATACCQKCADMNARAEAAGSGAKCGSYTLQRGTRGLAVCQLYDQKACTEADPTTVRKWEVVYASTSVRLFAYAPPAKPAAAAATTCPAFSRDELYCTDLEGLTGDDMATTFPTTVKRGKLLRPDPAVASGPESTCGDNVVLLPRSAQPVTAKACCVAANAAGAALFSWEVASGSDTAGYCTGYDQKVCGSSCGPTWVPSPANVVSASITLIPPEYYQ